MKELFIHVIIVFWMAGEGLAQAPGISWEKNLGGRDMDLAEVVIQTTDGGYLVAGYSLSDDMDVSGNYGELDCWLVKLEDSGAVVWEKHYGGSGNDCCFSIEQTIDNGFIMAGFSESSDFDVSANNGNGDFWVVKLDDSGGIVWEKNYGGSQSDLAYSILPTNEGGYIVAGESNSDDQDVSVNYGSSDYWILKLDSVGAVQWEKSFGGIGVDRARSVELTADGGYIVVGESESADYDISASYGRNDYWLLKLDSAGNLEWEKHYGGSDVDNAAAVIATDDGGYLIAGESRSSDHIVSANYGKGDFWIVKVDEAGAVQWEKNYGGTKGDAPFSVFQTNEGGYIIAGFTGSSDKDVSQTYFFMDCWIIKIDEEGTKEWAQIYGGYDFECARSIIQTREGGYVFAGATESDDIDVSKNNGNSDYWVVKLAGGTVNLYKSDRNAKRVLYPNPTSGTVSIDLGEVHPYIAVEVLNSLGQTTGRHNFGSSRIISFILDGEVGLYFFRISFSDASGFLPDENQIVFKAIKKE